jgi:hypothetical protein
LRWQVAPQRSISKQIMQMNQQSTAISQRTVTPEPATVGLSKNTMDRNNLKRYSS